MPIPKIKQQFLPIEQVFEEHNVLIQLPKDGEGKVKFIGDKRKSLLLKPLPKPPLNTRLKFWICQKPIRGT